MRANLMLKPHKDGAQAIPDITNARPLLAGIAERAAAADRGDADLGADIDALRRAGFLQAVLPRSFGGSGLGIEPSGVRSGCDFLRRLGRSNLSVARLVEGHLNAVKLIGLYDDGRQQPSIFERVRKGALMGVWGADAVPPVTLHEISGRSLRLEGIKRFASGLGLVDLAVITAKRQDQGVQLVVLAVDEERRMDASSWRTSGMRATASGEYDFSGLTLDANALLGEPGDFYREPHFEGGVWRYAATYVGGMEALAEAVRQHLIGRNATAEPHQEKRLAELALACEAGRLWIERAGEMVEAVTGDDATTTLAVAHALLAREAVERACLEAISITDRALGAVSFVQGHPVERIRRDLAFFLRQAALDNKLSTAARAIAGHADPVGEQW